VSGRAPLPGRPASPSRRVLAGVVLAAGLACLAVAQLFFTALRWFGIDLARVEALRVLALPWTASELLTFPPFALAGLALAGLGAVLFLAASHAAGPAAALLDWPRTPLAATWPFRTRPLRAFLAAALVVAGASTTAAMALGGHTPWLLPWAGGLAGIVWLAAEADAAGLGGTVGPDVAARSSRGRELARSAGRVLALFSLTAAVVLGIAAWDAHRPLLGAVFAGVAVALALHPGVLRGATREIVTERLVLVAIATLAFLLFSRGLRDWQWSVVGDEYAFHALAAQIASGQSPLPLLEGAGVYGEQPVLSSVVQAVSMKLFGTGAFGWRVSNPLLLALAIPPLYLFVRTLAGRAAALSAALLYGCSHFLMNFGKIGYNNAQCVPALLATLGVLAWASRSGSLAGFATTGVLVGLGFFAFGVARLDILVVGIWLLLLFPPTRRSARAVWYTVVGAALITALPALSQGEVWQSYLERTFLGSEVARTPAAVASQVAANVVHGLICFLTSEHGSHFVYGALVDPLTGSLAVLGIAILLAAAWRNRAALAFLLGGTAFVVALAGLQQYAYPSNTRMVAAVPLWTILAGLGVGAVRRASAGISRADAAEHRSRPSVLPAAALSAVVVCAVPLNLWIANRLEPRNNRTDEFAMLLQTAQQTADAHGQGPPIYLVAPYDFQVDLATYVWRVFDVPAERLHVAWAIPLARLAQLDGPAPAPAWDPCVARGPAVAVAPEWQGAAASAALRRIMSCWPGARSDLVLDGAGNTILVRIVNAQALSLVHRLPGVWSERPLTGADLGPPASLPPWAVSRPVSVADDGDGRVAVVEGDSHSVVLFDADGRPTRILDGGVTHPTAVASSPREGLAVLDIGPPATLARFTPDGAPIGRQPLGQDINRPRGLTIASDGSLWLADTEGGRIVHMNRQGDTLAAIPAPDPVAHPTDLAVAPDGTLVVAAAASGSVVVLDAHDRLRRQYAMEPGNDIDARIGLTFVRGDELLCTDPIGGRLLRLTLSGRPSVVVSGLALPTALAAQGQDAVLVALRDGCSVARVPIR
jgi:hypothetical protein